MSHVPEMLKILKQEEKVNFFNIKGHLQEFFIICTDRLPQGDLISKWPENVKFRRKMAVYGEKWRFSTENGDFRWKMAVFDGKWRFSTEMAVCNHKP